MATAKSFSIEEALKWGWKTTKENFGFILLILVIYYIVSAIPSLFQGRNGEMTAIGGVLSLAVFVVTLIMQMGITKMMLKYYDGGKPELKEIIYTKNIFEYFVATLIYGIIVFVGTLLFIVPGIYLALRYLFTPYLVVDKGMKPIDAMKKSALMTQNIKWDLFVYTLAVIGINILGLICLGVGMLVTIPVTTLGYVHIYRKVLGAN